MKIEILSSKEFKKLNEKSEDQSYSAGCIMGYFDKAFMDIDVKEEDLYNNEENEYGKEIEDHVTVLYGLTDDEIDESEIVKLFTMIDGPVVSTEQVSLFQNDKFDVVKFDIISDELTLLNKILTSTFPFKSTYPDYHAHSTIAYCLPGTGDSYVQTLTEPVEQKIAYWVYSKANGKKIKITPGIGEEILREARVDESITEPSIDFKTRSTENDFDEEYNGYTIKFRKSERFNDAYLISVFLGDEYKMGLRGPASLEKGKEAAIQYINSQL